MDWRIDKMPTVPVLTVIPFFVAINFKKLKIILFWEC